jgi:hypothetical protein
MEGERISLSPAGNGAGQEGPSASALQGLIGVFANPRRAFERMVAKPGFMVPLVLVVLAQAGFAVAIFQSGIVKSDTLAKLEAQEKAPDVIEATEKFFDSPAAPVVGAVSGAVVTAFVLLFNSALFFFVGNLMMGARLRFAHYLCAASYSAVVGLVDLAVRAGLAIGKGTLDVRLGLGNLFGEDPGFLGRVLDTMTNPLMLWPTAVAAVGVSVFAGKKFNFGAVVVLPAFLASCLLSGTQR